MGGSNGQNTNQEGSNGQNTNQFGERLGLLYKRWVLDCIPHIAHAVSRDFSMRPELYKGVADGAADNLTDIQSQYGYSSDFPNDDTRMMLLQPIFGMSDGHIMENDGSLFHTARMPVLTAAAAFSENGVQSGFPMLRERTRSAIVPFKRCMEDLEGASLKQTDKRVTALFDLSASVLRDTGVAAVFGVNEPIDDDWPLGISQTDSAGAKLVEKITIQMNDMLGEPVSRDQFVRRQRIAENGSMSIKSILEKNVESSSEDDQLIDQLITYLYAWGSDLKLIGGVQPQ